MTPQWESTAAAVAARPAAIYLMNLELSSGRKAIAYTDLLGTVAA